MRNTALWNGSENTYQIVISADQMMVNFHIVKVTVDVPPHLIRVQMSKGLGKDYYGNFIKDRRCGT